MAKRQYRVYVIELSRKVFSENRRFREANPQFTGMMQCVYVGQTSKDVYERFQQHKKGYRNKKGHKLSSPLVKKYGLYLRGSLFNHIEPVNTRAEALVLEQKVGLELRRKGYAVWWN